MHSNAYGGHPAQPQPSNFRIEADPGDGQTVRLLALPPGSRAAPATLWWRRFEVDENRDALLAQVDGGAFDAVFLGRLTMIFGTACIDELVSKIVADAREEHEAAERQAAEEARQHLVVHLYTRKNKRGRHTLELQRGSRDEPDWKVVYDRAVERDRLCDWLRWQQGRFLQFLDHAAEHGNEALTRLLTDEMFAAERRVKKEGRGAGGMRPLRMWRGD